MLEQALEKLRHAIAACDFSQALEVLDDAFEQIRESNEGDDWYEELKKEAQRLYDHKNVLVERADVQEPPHVIEREIYTRQIPPPLITSRKRNQRSHEASKCQIEQLNHRARKLSLLVVLFSDILQNSINSIKKPSRSQSGWRRRRRNNLPVSATNQTLLSGHLQALSYRRAKAAELQP